VLRGVCLAWGGRRAACAPVFGKAVAWISKLQLRSFVWRSELPLQAVGESPMDQIGVAGAAIDTHLEIEIFVVAFREDIGETAARPNELRLIHTSNSEIEGNRCNTRPDPAIKPFFGVPDQGTFVVIAADGDVLRKDWIF